MKWVLVVLVMNSPVKTDLVVDSYEACRDVEARMVATQVAYLNKSLQEAKKNKVAEKDFKSIRDGESQKVTSGVCIPTK
jgi:hypothetical protein